MNKRLGLGRIVDWRGSASNAKRAVRMPLLISLLSLAVNAQVSTPPPARKEPVTNDYFGVQIVDPYRWMEHPESREFQDWVKSQDDYAKAQLDRLPLRKLLLDELRELDSNLNSFPAGLSCIGDRCFYLRTPPPTDVYELFMRDSFTGVEKLVFDPREGEPSTSRHHSLGPYFASPDGKHVICSVDRGGSENRTLEIVDSDTGSVVENPIAGVALGGVSWHPDSRAFFYTHLPGARPGATNRFGKGRVYLHVLGENAENDAPVLGFGVATNVSIDERFSSTIGTSYDSSYMVGETRDGVGPNLELIVAPLISSRTNVVPWRRVCTFEDEVVGYALQDRSLFLISRHNAPNGKLLRISCEAPNLAKAQLIMSESRSILGSVAVAKDGFYVSLQEPMSSRLLRIAPGTFHEPQKLALPPNSSIARVIHDPRRPGVILSLASWTEPTAYYSCEPPRYTFIKLPLKGNDVPSLIDLEARQTRVKSKDGTLVPLTIILRRGLQKDSHRPTLLTGYGAYGFSERPHFDLSWEPWFKRGGVYAVAHVRGGGELGKEWQLAGKGAKKQNGVDDFIACAEYLVTEHYTAPAKMAAQTISAGAVLVGQAVLQRPELFGAAVIEVGALDALRFEVTPNGPPNIPEWGSSQTKEGFETLLKLSPYEHVRAGTAYPAMLFTTGINDPRVEPWMSAKMVARLQAATSGANPILLRVNYDEGHSQTTLSSITSHQSDILTFLLWRLGETDSGIKEQAKTPVAATAPASTEGGSGSRHLAEATANPAQFYFQAFRTLPTLSPREQDILNGTGNRSDANAILARCSESLALLRTAALAAGDCDWGLDKNAGPEMTMPHAVPAQELAKLGCLAAGWELRAGQTKAGIQDLMAVLMLGRSMGSDLTLNSVLIQFALDYLAAQTCAQNFCALDRNALEQLETNLRHPPAGKTLAESVRQDREGMLGWYEKRIDEIREQNLDDPENAMNLIADSLSKMEPGDWRQRLRQASANNPEAVLRLLRQTVPLYDEAAVLLDRPYAEFKATDAEFRNKVNLMVNPLPKAFLSAFISARTRAKEFRAETILAMLQAAIAWKLHGEQGLNQVQDLATGRPFSLIKTKAGFELRSAVEFEHQFVTLDFADQ